MNDMAATFGALDADSLGSLADAIKREFGSRAMVSLASTCTALWRGPEFRLRNGTGPHALKKELDLLRQDRIDGLQQKLECEDVRSVLRSSPGLSGFTLDAPDVRMIASLYLHDLTSEANGKAIRCVSVVLIAYARHLFRHEVLELAHLHLAPAVAQHRSSCLGRSVDGRPLPIDELMGVEAVDSINLSLRGLGNKSAIIISACIAGNRHLRALNLSANKLGKEGAAALAPAIRDSASLTSVRMHLEVLSR